MQRAYVAAQVFDTMDAQHLNVMMKDYMDGLSVKVFRTYNASLTLDSLLWAPSESTEIIEKCADYNRANKEVRCLSCLLSSVFSFSGVSLESGTSIISIISMRDFSTFVRLNIGLEMFDTVHVSPVSVFYIFILPDCGMRTCHSVLICI